MDAERSNVGSCLATDPEDAGEVPVLVKLNKFRFVDCAHAELALNSRNERRPLEELPSESLDSTRKGRLVFDGRVALEHGDILLSCTLLRLYEACSPVNAYDQAARDLWIKGTAVPRLFYAQDSPNPCDNLVRRWVCRLVQVDDPRVYVILQVPLERCAPRKESAYNAKTAR